MQVKNKARSDMNLNRLLFILCFLTISSTFNLAAASFQPSYDNLTFSIFSVTLPYSQVSYDLGSDPADYYVDLNGRNVVRIVKFSGVKITSNFPNAFRLGRISTSEILVFPREVVYYDSYVNANNRVVERGFNFNQFIGFYFVLVRDEVENRWRTFQLPRNGLPYFALNASFGVSINVINFTRTLVRRNEGENPNAVVDVGPIFITVSEYFQNASLENSTQGAWTIYYYEGVRLEGDSFVDEFRSEPNNPNNVGSNFLYSYRNLNENREVFLIPQGYTSSAGSILKFTSKTAVYIDYFAGFKIRKGVNFKNSLKFMLNARRLPVRQGFRRP